MLAEDKGTGVLNLVGVLCCSLAGTVWCMPTLPTVDATYVDAADITSADFKVLRVVLWCWCSAELRLRPVPRACVL